MIDQRGLLLRSAGIRLAIALILNLSLAFLAQAQPKERQKFVEWSVICEVDRMTDKKNCFIISQTVNFAFSNGRLMAVSVGIKHYPGSNVVLRIDSEPALSTKAPAF